MLTVSKTLYFDAAHLLDGHPGQCKNLHGHTYRVTVEVGTKSQPNTPQKDMVVDFKDLKDALHQVLDVYDHAFIYNRNGKVECELAAILAQNGLKTVAHDFRTTSENLAQHFYAILSKNLPVTAVTVAETQSNVSTYRPE